MSVHISEKATIIRSNPTSLVFSSPPVHIFALLFILALSNRLAAADPKEDERLMLAGRVRVLLEKKCNDCHGSQLEQPEGEFGYVLDLKKIAENPNYIVPGDPSRSELFRQVRDGDMPPYDQTKIARLTPDEVNSVRRWILAGAPSKLPAILPKPSNNIDPAVLSDEAYDVREKAKKARVTLDIAKQPVAVILQEITKKSGVEVDYVTPAKEPILNIKTKNGTVFEALEYLALCGNFSLTFTDTAPRIGPNPPPEIPTELPPVRPPNKRQAVPK